MLYCYDIKKSEEAAKLELEVNKFMKEDSKKLNFRELMLEEEEKMAMSDKKEHRAFPIQYEAFQNIGWRVVPNPRKQEANDVFLISSDGNVWLVCRTKLLLTSQNEFCLGISRPLEFVATLSRLFFPWNSIRRLMFFFPNSSKKRNL